MTILASNIPVQEQDILVVLVRAATENTRPAAAHLDTAGMEVLVRIPAPIIMTAAAHGNIAQEKPAQLILQNAACIA